MFMVSWIKQFANKCGDILPFGDSNQTEIRLPLGNKKLVHQVYCEALEKDSTCIQLPLNYEDFVSVWKARKDLSHIKCSKYKPGFSKCDKCSEFNRIRKKQLDEVQKEAALAKYQTHLLEERSEREQYYAARNKAGQNPKQYLSLIIDSMDQRKTCIPYWLNPPKCLGTDYSLKNRVIGVIAHGFGTFLYWCTPQLKHDTDLTIECLRRTLLKYQQEKGSLPPVLYLQMDNASDNKSRRFFSFLAYLISKNVFQKIKVSYLVVGHTHEDIDGYFSVISRYFKKTLQQVLTISAFIHGLFSSSKTAPKCVEQIQYCFDCSVIEEHVDKHIARFNLKEETGDKCHYFLFWNDSVKGPVMQYKIYRSNEGLYPRKYMPNCQYEFSGFGMGKVISTTPEKDFLTNEKFWRTKVCFRNDDGSEFEESFQISANESAMQVFQNSDLLPSEADFLLIQVLLIIYVCVFFDYCILLIIFIACTPCELCFLILCFA
jgi:hypothetical protein